MIRKISIDQLLPGMYVVDLHKRWFDHSLWQSKFKVRDDAHVWKLREEGISDISIDTAKGLDLPRGGGEDESYCCVGDRVDLFWLRQQNG